ncbi:hypothetical protein FSHL1_006493 [Fusarium sambucinum]
MPPIKIEDGDSQTAQLLPNNPRPASPTHPDLVTQSITYQRSDISTIEVLRTARKWKITSHEAITRDDVEITSVTPTVKSPCVVILANGVDSEGVPFEGRLFTERDVQLVSKMKLASYWRGKRGRNYAAGIPDDICHVLRVLEEKNGWLRVQFVGYSTKETDTEWWESDKVKATYIELWDEWVQARDAIKRESD